jgi:hypothetical protein
LSRARAASLRAAQLLVLAVAVAAAHASAGSATAASKCPTQTFLSFDHLAYAATPLRAAAGIEAGTRLGTGIVDEPSEPSGCKRRRESLGVVRAVGIDPRVAVMVDGRRGTLFVLGARCAGYEAAERWRCLLHPLVFGGRQFTGTRYPVRPGPQGQVPLGTRLGEADLDGRPETVLRIDGVPSSLAVGVNGRPSDAFLAPGVCPYEGFENARAEDDLLRCLRSPVWFTFDPPGGRAGDAVTARSDRPLDAELAGATISLVRLPRVADFVPSDRSSAVRIGVPRAEFRLTVPDVPPGLYEAVVSCPRCASTAEGRTQFPAGSILVTGKAKTSTAIRLISYLLGALVLASVIASVIVFRRSRRRRLGSPPSSESGSADS